MTKRFGDPVQSDNKKQKTDNDLDDLWGDDIDEEAIDNCYRIATQSSQKEDINISFASSYTAFKVPNKIFTSTQHNSTFQASTSKASATTEKSIVDLEKEISILKEKCMEKEGEVSVLRAQLKNAQSNIQNEKSKCQKELVDKLHAKELEISECKSTLNFKDLEIANLRQKISEISKSNYLNLSLSCASTSPKKSNKSPNTSPNKRTSEASSSTSSSLRSEFGNKSIIKEPIIENSYPLKFLLTSGVFAQDIEEKLFQEPSTSNKKNGFYVQNLICSHKFDNEVNKSNLSLRSVLIDKTELKISCVYPEMLYLVSLTQKEINSTNNNSRITKIVFVFIQFANDLLAYLEQLENRMRIETIQQLDFLYLHNKFEENLNPDDNNSCKSDCGINGAYVLKFISEIILYNNYLQNFICQNGQLNLDEVKEFAGNFPWFVNGKRRMAEPFYFLKLILRIVSVIGRIRMSHATSLFLSSVVRLLTNICKVNHFEKSNDICDIFCNIAKEIFFSRPTFKVLEEVSYLLKVASQYPQFVKFLFDKPKNGVVKISSVKCYFNGDSCRFLILGILIDNTIMRIKDKNFPLILALNLLSFMYNTYKWCFDLHHQNKLSCQCLPQLFKLIIGIIFNGLQRYKKINSNNETVSGEWTDFYEMVLKIINLMTFNSFDMTEKYVSTYSQFIEVAKTLSEIHDDFIENVNILDTPAEVSSNHFRENSYW